MEATNPRRNLAFGIGAFVVTVALGVLGIVLDVPAVVVVVVLLALTFVGAVALRRS